MNRPSAGQTTGLAGILVGAAAITGVIAQIELSKQSQANIWSNAWLLASVVLGAIAVLVVAAYFLVSIFARGEGESEDDNSRADEPGADRTGYVPPQEFLDSGAPDQPRVASALRGLPGDRMGKRIMVNGRIVPAGTSALGVRTGPAFTGRWRHTPDGFEASPLMRTANLSMPGFMSVRGQSPQIRIGAVYGVVPRDSAAPSVSRACNLRR